VAPTGGREQAVRHEVPRAKVSPVRGLYTPASPYEAEIAEGFEFMRLIPRLPLQIAC
jgi:hypothetical protein